MDRFDAMRLYTRIVDLGSFTRAADDLQLPRATVTLAIQQLEKRLGTRLLQRTTRHVSPTPDGTAYYARCQRLLADLEETESAFSTTTAPRGLLRVDLQGTLARRFVLPRLGEFCTRYPGVELEIGMGDRLVDLVREGMDCVLRSGELSDSSMVARRVALLPQLTCASPAYLAQHGTPRTVQELAGHRALHLPVDSPRHWPLLGENIACQRVLACNNITLAREAALAGAGIAALPVMISEAAVQDGELIELLPEARLPTGELYAVYPSRRFQAMKVKAFLDFLIASLPQAGLLEPAGAGLLTSRL